jgi:hypothetical protein
MNKSTWDILTGLTLLGVLCLIGIFGLILFDPTTPLNPLPPSVVGGREVKITPIILPSATMTMPGLPPTWTPSPLAADAQAPASNPGGTAGLKPSSTPIPTNTVVMLPTFTPSKTARSGIGGGTCLIVYQEPADNSTKKVSSSFDVRWTIKNSSGQSWDAGSVDIRYIGGDRMHSGNDLRDMPYTVGQGGMLDLVIPMTAPGTAGTYTSNWQLAAGSKALCNFFVQIRTY